MAVHTLEIDVGPVPGDGRRLREVDLLQTRLVEQLPEVHEVLAQVRYQLVLYEVGSDLFAVEIDVRGAEEPDQERSHNYDVDEAEDLEVEAACETPSESDHDEPDSQTETEITGDINELGDQLRRLSGVHLRADSEGDFLQLLRETVDQDRQCELEYKEQPQQEQADYHIEGVHSD